MFLLVFRLCLESYTYLYRQERTLHFLTAACTYWDGLKAYDVAPLSNVTLGTPDPRYILEGPMNLGLSSKYLLNLFLRMFSEFSLIKMASSV